MLTLYEWRPSYNAKGLCGHTIPAGAKGFKLSLTVCAQHAAWLPQKALQEAIVAEPEAKQPGLGVRIWHWLFRKRRKNTLSVQQPITVPAATRLACGHALPASKMVLVHTCAKGSTWPLTVLLACMQVLQQTAPPSCKPNQRRKNIYTYQPAAN